MTNRFRVFAAVMLLSLPAVLLSGCASPGLRGTPYYSTESAPQTGKPEDRIPLWPLVYYRSPTLSVLWPLFEKSDEFMALRPLASFYWGKQEKVYSLLWPLGSFDRGERRNRFFPFFWGAGYVVGFPLYWHFDRPLSPTGGTDALIPLWWFTRDRQGVSANLFWPFLQVKDGLDGRGWRVWPVMGSYARGADETYRFLAWPIAHQWSRGRNDQGHAVLPLYLRTRDSTGAGFFSLPYSTYSDPYHAWHLLFPLLYHGRDREGSKTLTPLASWGGRADDSRSWQLVLPLYYTSRHGQERFAASLLGGLKSDAKGTGWLALPLLSGGSHWAGGHSVWLLGPLAHSGRDPTGTSRHVAPLFYSSSNATGRTFVSVPWSSASDRKGNSWQLIPPLMLRMGSPDSQRLFTPLYSAGTSQKGAGNWQTVLPLWYHREGPDGKLVATLLGGWRTGADGRTWLLWPLLTGGGRQPEGREFWVLAPFYHAKWDRAGLSQHLLPFFWWDAHDRTFVSPLLARWGNPAEGKQTTLVPPLLSSYSKTPRSKDLWAAGGLAHVRWGEEPGSSHVVPLYYRNPTAFVSLPWSRWIWNHRSTNTVVAPLLSWLTQDARRSDLWTLGPLAHASWGAAPGPSHLFPLFYRHPRNGTFVSLPYVRWTTGRETRQLYPPLLSMHTRSERGQKVDAFLGLFSEAWGMGRHDGYFFPFYYHDKWDKVYTLLAGWNRDPRNGFFYPLTPLLGVRTGRHSGGWLQPLWSRDHDLDAGTTSGNVLWGTYRSGKGRTESGLLPFYGYRNTGPVEGDLRHKSLGNTYGKTFWCFPACWYRNTVAVVARRDPQGGPGGQQARAVRDHGFLPFWTFTHTVSPVNEETYGTLFLLYDYTHRIRPASASGQPASEYVRKRILWKFYDYERTDEKVTIDVFPAITYDQTRDGLRKWAFLWRAFRYETGPDGRKLDLLFIPLLRTGAAPPAKDASAAPRASLPAPPAGTNACGPARGKGVG